MQSDVSDTPSLDLSTVDNQMLEYFNYDLVLLPFFFDSLEQNPLVENHKHVYIKNEDTGEMETLCGCEHEKRAVMVSVKVLDNSVDLFDVEHRSNDNHDISNSVLHIMEIASKQQDVELDEDMIDAEIENIDGIKRDEDLVVVTCYIAECFTFGKEPDLENIDLDY